MYYILFITFTNICIILGNLLYFEFTGWNFLYISLNSVTCTLAVVALDGIGSLAVRRLLPSGWFRAGRSFFRVGKREHKLYLKMKIKSWKDKVPELGGATGFSKSVYTGSNELSYLGRFLLENNYGVMCHLQNAVCGFLILFIPMWWGGAFLSVPGVLGIWLPVAIVNFVLSLLPAFILRYTSYTLLRLYEKKVAKEAVQKGSDTTAPDTKYGRETAEK